MVELGGGTNPHPRADYVIDLHHPKQAPAQDATAGRWKAALRGVSYDQSPADATTIPDGHVDEVFASHFLEHVPAGQPRIDVFNEAWRVLRSGGTFTMVHPLIGYTDPTSGAPCSDQIGWQPWADPTHVSQWWFPESLLYFCQGPFKPHASYGISEWAPITRYLADDDASVQLGRLRESQLPDTDSWWSVRSGWEGVARLVKP
jgi:hypothetical protein